MAYEPTRPADRPAWMAEIHGTRSRYRKGCGCEPCRAAEAAYRAEYRKRTRTGPEPTPADATKRPHP